jgi:hypothetical protein
MMLPCKYCSGTGKLHDDADAFNDHEEDESDKRMRKLEAVAEAAHAVNELFNYKTMHALDDALSALESDE